MFAVVQVGSLQYKISEGDTIEAFRLEEEEGKSITLDKVLLFANGDDVRIGRPYLKDVKITAEVVDHPLDNKVIAFKFRRRKNSARIRGHRQKLTSLHIKRISA